MSNKNSSNLAQWIFFSLALASLSFAIPKLALASPNDPTLDCRITVGAREAASAKLLIVHAQATGSQPAPPFASALHEFEVSGLHVTVGVYIGDRTPKEADITVTYFGSGDGQSGFMSGAMMASENSDPGFMTTIPSQEKTVIACRWATQRP